MSAEILREAAKVLRERAKAATRPEAMHPWGDKSLPSLPASAHPTEVEGYLGGSWGTYYATMHPGVGLTLAAWLDSEAELGTYRGQCVPSAVDVARAILGGAS